MLISPIFKQTLDNFNQFLYLLTPQYKFFFCLYIYINRFFFFVTSTSHSLVGVIIVADGYMLKEILHWIEGVIVFRGQIKKCGEGEGGGGDGKCSCVCCIAQVRHRLLAAHRENTTQQGHRGSTWKKEAKKCLQHYNAPSFYGRYRGTNEQFQRK